MNNPFNYKEDNEANLSVTVDELALMTKKGFDEMSTEFANVRSEMATEFANVRSEMKEGFGEVKKEFAVVRSEMNQGFSGLRQSIALVLENMATKSDIERLESHLGDVEHTVYKDHSPRLKRVEHKLQIV